MDNLTIGVVAWWNDAAQKGMMLDADGNTFPFDYRNLDEQPRETGCHEGHIVAAEITWRNGFGR